jgi:hypothetical protein
MSKQNTDCTNWATSGRSNSLRLMGWNAAWVASMALAAFGPKLLWDYSTLPTMLFVLVNLGVGFAMIAANRRYLRGLDELHQKIFLDSSVLTLGVGLVAGLSYELFEDVRLISFQPEISHLVVLMCLTFLAGMVAGHRKYR